MKTVKIFILVFSIKILFVEVVIGQRRDISVSIPSPNASSLGVYGEIPVSYSTGVPEISVPLYSIKGNKIGLNISMSYHASGIRPEIHPGWVGNGWSLIAGGVITRKPNGNIDEYKKSFSGEQGYYFNYSNLNNSNWSSKAGQNTSVVFPMVNPSSSPFPQYVDVDSEPDEFDFSFCGFSGKFFLDQTGQWRVQSDQYLKVVFDPNDFVRPFITANAYFNPNLGINPNNVTSTFGKFTIIDASGNQYIFGSTNPQNDINNSAIEFSDVMVPGNEGRGLPFTATSWFLSKIISSDGTEVINLNYERGPFTSFIGADIHAVGVIGQPGDVLNPGCISSTSAAIRYNGRIISPVYLTSITMPSRDLSVNFVKSKSDELNYSLNGSIDGAYVRVYNDAGVNTSAGTPADYPSFYLQFFTSPDLIPFFRINSPDIRNINRIIWLKLDKIEIQNTASGSILNTIGFNYLNDPSKRLQLNSLNINGAAGLPHQVYKFTYNETPLPAYLTTFTDHWGFNNNTTLSLGFSNNYDVLRASDPTGALTKAGILTDIIYPTGGSVKFLYEPNYYSSAIHRNNGVLPSLESGIAGGVRIKKIIKSDAKGNNLSTTYYYLKNYTWNSNISSLSSSGVLDSKPIYDFTVEGKDVSNVSYYFSSISSNSVIPLTSNSAGSHIGYSEVVELLDDNSFTIYQFSNHDNGYTDDPPVSSFNRTSLNYYQWGSNQYKRGKLIRKTDYKNDGQKVLDEVINYTVLNPGNKANAVLSERLQICLSGGRVAVSRSAYQIPYSFFVPSARIVKSFGPLNLEANVKTENFVYDQYKNLVEESHYNSKGELEKIRYKYPNNFTTSNANNIYDIMVKRNMLNFEVEKLKTIVRNGSEYVSGGDVGTYNLFSNIICQDKHFALETGSIIPYGQVSSSYRGLNSAGELNLNSKFVLQESFSYDNRGYLSSVVKNGGKRITYLRDHNTADVVAKVEGTSITSSVPSSLNSAYNSFEYHTANSLNYGTGNWNGISLANITRGSAYSGYSCYSLNNSTLTVSSLSAIEKYIVSYWSRSGPYSISGSQQVSMGVVLPSGWTFYQHKVTGTSTVALNGTGYIDELRLYPEDAQMISYTYEPLIGLKSITDQKNQLLSYQYDYAHRLNSERDQFNNIVKYYSYQYAGPAEKPVINGLSVAGKTVSIDFSTLANCSTILINSYAPDGRNSSNAGGCSSPRTDNVLITGRTYWFTITSYPGGVTSEPMSIYVP